MLPRLIDTICERVFFIRPFTPKPMLTPNRKFKTVYPKKRMSFNEWIQYINNQLN
jgi:hypothetical protein